LLNFVESNKNGKIVVLLFFSSCGFFFLLGREGCVNNIELLRIEKGLNSLSFYEAFSFGKVKTRKKVTFKIIR